MARDEIREVLVDRFSRSGLEGLGLLDELNFLQHRPKAFMLIKGFLDISLEGAKKRGADALLQKPLPRGQDLMTKVLKILDGDTKVDMALNISSGKNS